MALSALPKRVSLDAAMEFDSYVVATDGVMAHALAEATKRIMRGSLGHGFFPSPPELRMECDRIAAEEREAGEFEARQRRLQQEQDEYRSTPKSDESKRRVTEAYRRFCQSHAARKLDEATQSFRSGMPNREHRQ